MADDGGLSRFQKRMRAIPAAVRAAVGPALVKAAEETAALMRQLAETSRETGDLIDSIEVTGPGGTTPRHSQPGGTVTIPENAAAITAGNSEVRYAHLVEYGTVRTTAKPFFAPAVRSNRKRATARIKRAMAKAARDNWGGK